MIPDDFKQTLLNRVDIVGVIERYVPLKKAGQNYVARCPFHSEKSPSFSVSPTKQFYHCFGCGAHGNAIGFLMEYAGLGYVEAVKDLAAGVGMQVPAYQRADEHAARAEAAADLGAPLLEAARFYKQQLKSAPVAIEYLKRRGLTGEIASRFGIGYAPGGWQSLAAVFPDYQSQALVDCGLVIAGEGGKRYDRFRDRVMFPILDARGRIIGFGGRVLDTGEPKYLNSPETPLFEKGRELYGLWQARQALREAGRVLVVEGYMDVVALAQFDVGYAVATLGTATTPVHVQKLLRQVDEVVYCFDGDAAGRRAAWRALENSLGQVSDGKRVSFLFLPQDEDPDSYVRKHGKAAFEALLDDALPLSAFLVRELVARVDLDSEEGRARLLHEAKPMLAQIAAPGLAMMLRKRFAELARLSQADVDELMGVKRAAPVRSAPPKAAKTAPAGPERRLLRLVLFRPDFAARIDRGLLTRGDADARALAACLDVCEKHPDAVAATLVPLAGEALREGTDQAAFQEACAEIMNWGEDFAVEDELAGLVRRLATQRDERRMTELLAKPLAQWSSTERDEYQRLMSGRSQAGKNPASSPASQV